MVRVEQSGLQEVVGAYTPRIQSITRLLQYEHKDLLDVSLSKVHNCTHLENLLVFRNSMNAQKNRKVAQYKESKSHIKDKIY